MIFIRLWRIDPQAYDPYGEDQNHETSFKDKVLQAAVDSWCKIQVLILNWFQVSGEHVEDLKPDTILQDSESIQPDLLRYPPPQLRYNFVCPPVKKPPTLLTG